MVSGKLKCVTGASREVGLRRCAPIGYRSNQDRGEELGTAKSGVGIVRRALHVMTLAGHSGAGRT